MSETTFLDGRVSLHAGDCLDVIRTLPDNLFDSVVTDPPYALVSITKRWGKPNAAPCKSDGASGVYKRATAGFMGKQWDTGERAFAAEFWAEVLRVLKPGGHVVAFSGTRTYHRMTCAIEDAGFEIRDQLAWTYGSGFPKSHNMGDGWGTALKPAWEPIAFARKPLIGTVAENMVEHGTGALNIDGCRIETSESLSGGAYAKEATERGQMWGADAGNSWKRGGAGEYQQPTGRWPANIIHDGSDEVIATFPETSSGAVKPGTIDNGKSAGTLGAFRGRIMPERDVDTGSAARFFYSAKADANDRLGSKHPTVKPVDLMQWLVRLVTPKGGLVLDPFAGTGTTGEAAFREGMRAVLIEREAEYREDIGRRMELALAGPDERKRAIIRAKAQPIDNTGTLFQGLEAAE